MALCVGTRLGHYEIVSRLGSGGMGDVYRARDSRLDRDVAIKVLPETASANAELRQRFEREARAIAALNHPNICTLHDIGRSGDTDYLVMELVEGQTLAQRLAHGPLPVAEVLKLGREIAEALARAHHSGVLHRDLKPGNIMLSKSGAKLMDFGLARLIPKESGGPTSITQAPTASAPLTGEGRIVGTFQYMAPEQLEGREADVRSDIWSLGATLYEIATGRPAFEGTSPASVISAILRDQPRSLGELAPLSPPALDRVVHSCLAKDPEARWQCAADLARELAWIDAATGASSEREARTSGRPSRRSLQSTVVALVTLVAATAVLQVTGRAPWSDPGTRRIVRTHIPFSSEVGVEILAASMAVSPDGSALALALRDSTGLSRLCVRRLEDLTPKLLPLREPAYLPFWSPDSREIAFLSESDRLMRIRAAGGQPQTICDATDYGGGSWGARGWIVFAAGTGGELYRVRSSGGAPEKLIAPDSSRGEHRFLFPFFLADGEHFVFAVEGNLGFSGHFEIRVGSVRGGPAHRLLEADGVPRPAPGGWLVYIRDRTLLAQRVDQAGDRLIGDPKVLSELPTRSVSFSVAEAGPAIGGNLMAYSEEDMRPSQLRWFDRDGRPGPTVALLPGWFGFPEISPDSRRATLHVLDGLRTHLWLLDLLTGEPTRLTDPDHLARSPKWLGDSRHIVYTYIGQDAFEVRETDVENPQASSTLIRKHGLMFQPHWISRDGSALVATQRTGVGGDERLVIAEAGSGWEPRVYLRAASSLPGAQIFDNGRYIAYTSTVTGVLQIYADTYPTQTRPVRLTQEPVGQFMSVDPFHIVGRELIYCAADGQTLRSAELDVAGPAVSAQPPRTLFVLPPECRGAFPSPDGRRFLIATPRGSPQAPTVTIVQNWQAELGR